MARWTRYIAGVSNAFDKHVPIAGTILNPLGTKRHNNIALFRRKKTKCSGERPICFPCRRVRATCVYEPYSATVGDINPAVLASAVASNNDNVSWSSEY